jgi:hypothetical protein
MQTSKQSIRVIGMKSPCKMLLGENKFLVPPKAFGCTCFVRDYKASVGKLDPRAIECIFIGYPRATSVRILSRDSCEHGCDI